MEEKIEPSAESSKDSEVESSAAANRTELTEDELEQVDGGSKFVSNQKNTQLKAKGGRAGEEAFDAFVKS